MVKSIIGHRHNLHYQQVLLVTVPPVILQLDAPRDSNEMHIQPVHVHLDIAVPLLKVIMKIPFILGKCASVVSHQHLEIRQCLKTHQDKVSSLMLNVELQFKTIAPRTQLNQVTVHLATHQLDAQPDFHV